MATGHILPGYGQTVTSLRRARSAGRYPLDTFELLEFQKSSRLSQHEFDKIRENARQLWSNRISKPTTYDTYFSGGEILEITQAQARPTSSNRRNNPHPPEVFLTNRLHYIGSLNKTQGDKEDSPLKQEEKLQNQKKYATHYDSVLLNQFKDPNGFKSILPPRQAQAAEAWVKLADDTDKERVFDIVRDHEDWNNFQDDKLLRRPKTAYPSLQRWMKLSGAEENEAHSQTMMKSRPLVKYENSSYYDQKRRDNNTSAGQIYQHPRIRRGDYSIHPGWPSSLPHHRVP